MPPLITSIDDITLALLANDVPDETPVVIQDNVTSLHLSKLSRDTIYDRAVSLPGGSIKMPGSLSGLLSNSTDDSVLLQVNIHYIFVIEK